MVAIGDIIDVEVRSVEVFGIFCSFNDQELLVLIPDISWIASFCSCDQFAIPGDRFRVKVRHVDTDSGKVAGSIKDLHPNPWEAGEFQIGSNYLARVVRRVTTADRCDGKAGYLLEVLPGAFAMLCSRTAPLSVNQQCAVTVTESDSLMRSVRLAVTQHSS